MKKKLYVGNLPYTATETDVRDLFTDHGEIVSLVMITDRLTGKFRGFCFVEMDEGEAEKAEVALNQKEFQGRQLVVNQARPRATGREFSRDTRSNPSGGQGSTKATKKRKGSRRRRKSNFDLF